GPHRPLPADSACQLAEHAQRYPASASGVERGGGLMILSETITVQSPLSEAGPRVKKLEFNAGLLTRNWMLNLLGWVVPLSVALIAVPYVVTGLGSERFGVLSLASALLGYFGIFDLGLGRAMTKIVAECLAREDLDQLPKVVW